MSFDNANVVVFRELNLLEDVEKLYQFDGSPIEEMVNSFTMKNCIVITLHVFTYLVWICACTCVFYNIYYEVN